MSEFTGLSEYCFIFDSWATMELAIYFCSAEQRRRFLLVSARHFATFSIAPSVPALLRAG